MFFNAPASERPAFEAPPVPAVTAGSAPVSLDERLHDLESNLIAWALQASGGNKSRAAELLHIKRSTLGDRIARCGLASGAPLDPPAPAQDARAVVADRDERARDDVPVH